MRDLGFEPITDLSEAANLPRVAFPGQTDGEYAIVQVHWQPETTGRRGLFEPMEGIELTQNTSYGQHWLAGEPIGFSA